MLLVFLGQLWVEYFHDFTQFFRSTAKSSACIHDMSSSFICYMLWNLSILTI